MTRHRPPRRFVFVIALGAALALPACGEEDPAPAETAQRPDNPSADRLDAPPQKPAATADAAANGAQASTGDPDAPGEGGAGGGGPGGGGPGPRALVVRADGPSAGSFPIGKLVSARQSLNLRPADTLAVLFEGIVLEFKGPRVFSIAEREGSVVDEPVFDWEQGRVRGRLAATRRQMPRPPFWAAAVTASGRHCLPSASPPQLWYGSFSAPDATETVTVTDAASGVSAPVEFSFGARGQPWPGGVPFGTNRLYLFATGDSPATRLVFVRVDLEGSPADDPVETLALLSDQGCSAQVQRVARSIAGES